LSDKTESLAWKLFLFVPITDKPLPRRVSARTERQLATEPRPATESLLLSLVNDRTDSELPAVVLSNTDMCSEILANDLIDMELL
jgi:hypothetical protein